MYLTLISSEEFITILIIRMQLKFVIFYIYKCSCINVNNLPTCVNSQQFILNMAVVSLKYTT